MDYVVFGIGFGATILVLGLLFRDLGPRVRYRHGANDDGVLPADILVAKISWNRFCLALGTVLAICGVLVLLATVTAILLRLSDRAGGWVMLGALVALVLIVLVWTWAFFDRFGSYGILPERAAAEPEPAAQPVPVGPAPAEVVTADDAAAPALIGPPLPEVDVDTETEPAPEAESDTGAAPAPEGVASEVEDDSETDQLDNAPDAESEDAEDPATETVETPEERLARAEEPLDHESAAGDLDTAPGIARPMPEQARAERRDDVETETSSPNSQHGDDQVDEAEAPAEEQVPERQRNE